jgi:isovaleryl-CoA dehydrogenase
MPSPALQDLLRQLDNTVAEVIAPGAQKVDRDGTWPAHSMRALADTGLLGLHVPAQLGGHGQGLLALVLLTEKIASSCPSSALCFGMHNVGTAVIAAKATEYQQQHYLRPIAAGEHITTLALSEAGSGAHFYLPATRLAADGGELVVDGTKAFVTNGGHADSYVVSTLAATGGSDDVASETGDFSCLLVDKATPGIQWMERWEGFGMRGNASRGMRLDQCRVPGANLLGEQGDQVWYVFEVVAPFFLMAMAGTYLGIAQSALDAADLHLRGRHYEHSGQSLADIDTLQARFGQLWTEVARTRAFVIEAARRGDSGHPEALPYILACKAAAGDTAVLLANEAMTLCGGSAYRDDSRIGQMLRDARASHVMSPTTDLLKLWTGRTLLGRPLL